ncbi:SipW-dependent-type signal peptide-containing protein, partial [Acinetobacter baumannii]
MPGHASGCTPGAIGRGAGSARCAARRNRLRGKVRRGGGGMIKRILFGLLLVIVAGGTWAWFNKSKVLLFAASH